MLDNNDLDFTVNVDIIIPEEEDNNDIQMTIKTGFRFETLQDRLDCIDYQRQYSILLKSAYVRLLAGMNHNDVYAYLTKELKNVNDLDTAFAITAMQEAKAMVTKEKKAFKKLNKELSKKKKELLTWEGYIKTHRTVFRRKNLYKRSKGFISEEKFKHNKNMPLCNYGELAKKGNRKFALDMLNNRVIFKLHEDKYIYLILPKLRQNRYKELCLVQLLMEQNKLKATFKIDKNELFISYEPITKELKNNTLDNRIIGLDVNPSEIGVAILEFDGEEFKILYKICIFMADILKLKKDERDNEYILIAKQIEMIMKAFHVRNIALEDINIEGKDYGKGAALNVCLNQWNRNLMFDNIRKRCKIEGFKVWIVNPAHSSTIGNLQYDYYDPINAAIEIARRGYLYKKLNMKEQFYPIFEPKNLKHQWKDVSETWGCKGWVELHKKIKNSEMKYRVPLPENGNGFRRTCIKHIPIGIF
jgi:IS605 OrfB family transposase